MRFNTPENTSAAPAQGFSRRQVTTAAAWSLPVIALAVAAPAASASNLPVDQITMSASFGVTPSTVTYGIGQVFNQNPSSSAVSTGDVTLTFTIPASYVFSVADQDAMTAMGWTLLDSPGAGATSGAFSFLHTAVTGATKITFPQVSFVGTAKAKIEVEIDSAIGYISTSYRR